MADGGRFVRVPTALLEVLLRANFRGGQLRVILWMIRNTYGWNRPFTPFTWDRRRANDLRMNRSAVYRAGEKLVDACVLARRDRQLGVCPSFGDPAESVPGVACQQQKRVRQAASTLPGATRTMLDGTFFRRAKKQ